MRNFGGRTVEWSEYRLEEKETRGAKERDCCSTVEQTEIMTSVRRGLAVEPVEPWHALPVDQIRSCTYWLCHQSLDQRTGRSRRPHSRTTSSTKSLDVIPSQLSRQPGVRACPGLLQGKLHGLER